MSTSLPPQSTMSSANIMDSTTSSWNQYFHHCSVISISIVLLQVSLVCFFPLTMRCLSEDNRECASELANIHVQCTVNILLLTHFSYTTQCTSQTSPADGTVDLVMHTLLIFVLINPPISACEHRSCYSRLPS